MSQAAQVGFVTRPASGFGVGRTVCWLRAARQRESHDSAGLQSAPHPLGCGGSRAGDARREMLRQEFRRRNWITIVCTRAAVDLRHVEGFESPRRVVFLELRRHRALCRENFRRHLRGEPALSAKECGAWLDFEGLLGICKSTDTHEAAESMAGVNANGEGGV